jgi:glutamate-1-semialdehyde 2,1-aminomutase
MTYQTSGSQELFAQAQSWLEGGVGSGTRSPGSGWVPSPIYVEYGQGAHLWDVDGNDYIDYLMACGPLILGHRPQPVTDAVCRTLQERGSLFALAHDLEIEASRRICESVPSIEKVRFDNSGTSAVQRAVRLARAYTGKAKIVRFEGHYHGWSDQLHWSNRPALEAAGRRIAPRPLPNSNGIPEVLADTLIVLPWNDADLLTETIEAHRHDIACVITEPILGNTGGIMPRPGYLETMRAVTAANNVVLIFDEVLTGFRVALGGVQQLFGVTPDLTTLAKAMAAGFPAAAVGGRAEIMDLIAAGDVMYGGTYNSNPIVTSAVIATLDQLSQPDFYTRLTAAGEKLASGMVDIARVAGLPASWAGVGPLSQLWFCEEEQLPHDYRAAVPLMKRSPFHTLWREMMGRGVILQPRQDGLFLISAAHTDADIEFTLEAAQASMPAVKRAFEQH